MAKVINIGAGGGDSNAVECTLVASEWKNGYNTISVSGLGADTNGMIGLSQNITPLELEAACDAKMYISGQTNGMLTIVADGDIPACDIPVVVILLG